MEDLATPAPAQVENTPAPLTPSKQAAQDNDFAGYRAAKREERAPSPPSKPVEAPKAELAPPAQAAEPKTSNRQARINEYERTIAQQRAKIAELETAHRPPSSAPAPKVEAAKPADADPEPDPSDATKYPDGQYDRQFLKDQARWEARQEYADRETKQQEAQRKEQADRTRADAERTHAERTKAFVERVNAAREKDAETFGRIDPKLFDLTPSIARKDGEPITFGHAVADVIVKSNHPVALMAHLSDPQEVDRLANLSPDDFFREIGVIEAGLAQKAAPPIPKLTNAPPPVPTVGDRAASPTDPTKRAVAENNFPAYRAAKAAERLAAHR